MNEFTYELFETTDLITGELIRNVLRSDGALIPSDLGNRDYQEYLASLEATEPEAE
jgi:hypothetical protein